MNPVPVDVRGGAENSGGTVGGGRVAHWITRADQLEGLLLGGGIAPAGGDGGLYRAVTPFAHLSHLDL